MESTPARVDRQRFVNQLHEHQRIVRRICAVYAARSEEREDLFQEIVMQLWRSWPSFRGDSSFATWAYRVALNTALFRRRKQAAERIVPARDDGGGLEAEPAASEPDVAEAKEGVELLYDCIRKLRELDRAIVLQHLEARPHAEIAEFAGLSVGNVAVRLHRIKTKLRECLTAGGYGEE
ncbi:MAG: RNA polymerase sigma factor [bacterium]|nr:RNA polymerase sigma factor [bacterium]